MSSRDVKFTTIVGILIVLGVLWATRLEENDEDVTAKMVTHHTPPSSHYTACPSPPGGQTLVAYLERKGPVSYLVCDYAVKR